LQLATDKYRDMPATDVANAAGVSDTVVRNYLRKLEKSKISIETFDSESRKTVTTARGKRQDVMDEIMNHLTPGEPNSPILSAPASG